MLKYNGYLKFDTPLSEEEVTFLNLWQSLVKKSCDNYKEDKEDPNCYVPIEQLLSLFLDKNQKWTLFFCYNPLISFDKNGIIINGESEKGQLREALLAYKHFFIGEDPVLKHCIKDPSILKSHTFSGIIESEQTKHTAGGFQHKTWCYIANNSDIYSVQAPTKEIYLDSPESFPKQEKNDTCMEKLDLYFPRIYSYSNLKKSIFEIQQEKELKQKQPIEKRNKI